MTPAGRSDPVPPAHPRFGLVGRLAPSPTGGLHLGHARTFLIAWLLARQAGGRLILRIEDLDTSRVRPEALKGQIEDLRWLGLDWDEGPDVGGPAGPYLQSQRLDRYRDALGRLRRADRVYPCTCTRKEIERAASAPHAEDEPPTYPGTCARRGAEEAEALERAGRPYAWRFRVEPGVIAWDDLIAGRREFDPARAGGDFVVARSAGEFAYQLAVVVDDARMGVNQVIRGDDLVASTPRQLLLYRALGLDAPAFGHVPLALGADGRRLAKRDQSIKLSTLRERGADPRWLVGWLALSCGQADSWEPSTPANWIGRFDSDRIPRTPWVVSPRGLDRLLGFG